MHLLSGMHTLHALCQSFKINFRKMATQNMARIAVVQMRSTVDKQHNLQQIKTITERAKQNDVQFVFFPECCDFVGTNRNETVNLSEPLTGSTVQEYRKLARQHNLWLSFGGVHETIIEKLPGSVVSEAMTESVEKQNIYNTHIVIDNAGELVAYYRKLHLFNVNTPEFKFRESETVKAGCDLVPPIETPIGRIGLQICYDVRFPEPSTILRKLGAEILTYPSAFAVSTGHAHWEVLLRARAIENQCFVVAPAQIGFHNEKRASYGHAMVVNPWGVILGQTSDHPDLDVIVAELDFAKLASVRANMPCFEHRRDDVYSLKCLPTVSVTCHRATKYTFGGIEISPETIFYVSKHSFAFTNIRCVVPGHVLVATRRPAARLPDLSPTEINDFFQTVCKVQKTAELLYNATSSTVTVQDGPDAGQTISHVHCHIMPRHAGDFSENDQIYWELALHDKKQSDERRTRSFEDMTAEAERFRKEILKMGI